jgi:uncharacterized protein YjiS (DUF1127 family)
MLQRTQTARPRIFTQLHPLKEPTVFIVSLVARIQAYLRYRETVRELSKLSDRELDDLGLLRADIHNVARHYAAA